MRNLCVLLALSLVFVMTHGKVVSGETQIVSQTGEHPSGTEHPSSEEGSSSKEHLEHTSGGEGSASKEDPEHPSEGEGSGKKEHPSEEEGSTSKEQPENPPQKKAPVSIESVANYLEGYVGEKAAAQGGWMGVSDDETGEPLKLQLDKIHRERLAKTAEGTYFVCADFITPEGRTYDLDFWVKETDHGLRVTETTVHKEDGKPRYTWVEKDGIWSRKSLSDE